MKCRLVLSADLIAYSDPNRLSCNTLILLISLQVKLTRNFYILYLIGHLVILALIQPVMVQGRIVRVRVHRITVRMRSGDELEFVELCKAAFQCKQADYIQWKSFRIPANMVLLDSLSKKLILVI